jgi:hypothetical protein
MAALSMNFDEAQPREGRQDRVYLRAMGASHSQLDKFLIFSQIFRFRL